MSDYVALIQEIRASGSVERLDARIVDGFPAYLYLRPIIDVAIEMGGDSLVGYMARYVRTHPLNQILRGALYRHHQARFDGYNLFLAIRDGKTDEDAERVHDLCSQGPTPLPFSLIVRLFGHIAPHVVEALRLHLLVRRLDNVRAYSALRRRARQYASLDDARIEKDMTETVARFTAMADDDVLCECGIGDVSWSLIGKLDPVHRDRLLPLVFGKSLDRMWQLKKASHLLEHILVHGGEDLYWELITKYGDRFNLEVEPSHYVMNAHAMGSKVAVRLLRHLLGEFDGVSVPGRPHRGVSEVFDENSLVQALTHSVLARDGEMVRINRTLLKACRPEITDAELDTIVASATASVDAMGAGEPVPLSTMTEDELGRQLEDLLEDYDVPPGPKLARVTDQIRTLLNVARERGIRVPIGGDEISEYGTLYYLCENGERELLDHIVVVPRGGDGGYEGALPETCPEDLERMIRHFSERDRRIRTTVLETGIVHRGPLSIVAEYAGY